MGGIKLQLKLHKIRNIDKSICTCEQKIAYNLAFYHASSFKEKYQQLPTEAARSDALHKIRDFCIGCWKHSRDYTDKYNIDGIFVALNTGLNEYLMHPFIATTYEQIGKCFKIHKEYL